MTSRGHSQPEPFCDPTKLPVNILTKKASVRVASDITEDFQETVLNAFPKLPPLA